MFRGFADPARAPQTHGTLYHPKTEAPIVTLKELHAVTHAEGNVLLRTTDGVAVLHNWANIAYAVATPQGAKN